MIINWFERKKEFAQFAVTQKSTPPTAPPLSNLLSTKPHHGHHNTTQHHGHHGHHNTTHEPYEREQFYFTYSGTKHKMYIKTTPTLNCYIANLSPAEKLAVHTDSGLRALEMKLLRVLNFATKLAHNSSVVSQQDHRFCGTRFPNYYLVSV